MALDIFTKFATNEALESGGVWRDIGGDTSLLVARSGNRAYSRLLAREYEKHQQVLAANDDAAEAKSDSIMADVMSKTILLGWKNLQYKGKALEYSQENAAMLLKHKDFRRMVMSLADDQESYRVKEEVAQGEA